VRIVDKETANLMQELTTKSYLAGDPRQGYLSVDPQWSDYAPIRAVGDFLGEITREKLRRPHPIWIGPLFSVLDLACGHMGFIESILIKYPQATIDAYLVDVIDAPAGIEKHDISCRSVDTGNSEGVLRTIDYQRFDILGALSGDLDLAECINAPSCDVVFCAGFMNHIPLLERREKLLRALVLMTNPGGLLVVGFARRRGSSYYSEIREEHEQACRELGYPDLSDYDFLARAASDTGRIDYRYYHHFSNSEIQCLSKGCEKEMEVVSTPDSEYLIMRKRGTLPRIVPTQSSKPDEALSLF
jgi:SAM-dependent methyltransferase